MIRAALLLLLAGCAHAGGKGWEPAATCEPWPGVRVATEGPDCATVRAAFDWAAGVAISEGVSTQEELLDVAQRLSFVVLDVEHLYVNRRGIRVGGLLACDELPRVILDRGMRGLLHELVPHGRDCVSGARMPEPVGRERAAWRRFWSLGAW